LFVVFYTANLHICVFMTCSTSYCLYDTLMDPRIVCMCVFVCICIFYTCEVLDRKSLNFMFCCPWISIHLYNENQRDAVSSVYFVNQPLHVLSIFVAHHQEVYCIHTTGTCCAFQFTQLANRQSIKKHNTYQLLYNTVYLLMMGYKYARNT
jgi:hypothetical protein